MVVCPEDLAHRIKSYVYTKGVDIDKNIFPINRERTWQIVKESGEKSGFEESLATPFKAQRCH